MLQSCITFMLTFLSQDDLMYSHMLKLLVEEQFSSTSQDHLSSKCSHNFGL